jgi:hypothetical protein
MSFPLRGSDQDKAMRSNQYSETARTLLRVAKSMLDEAIANRLESLAGEYEQRAAAYTEAAKT